MTQKTPLKDRESTEKKILDAVGEIILQEGFERVGVNLVAQRAGISKMLIYRYFGSIDDLVAKYIFQQDYWINISVNTSDIKDVGRFIKDLFRRQIALLREDITLKRLYRWELSTNNPITKQLRAKRETNGCRLIEIISNLTNSPSKEIAALASILSASISYMALLEELNPTYNGIDMQSAEGWEQIADGVDLIIDLWINNRAI